MIVITAAALRSPIYVACCEGNLDMVRCLHENGADFDKCNAILQWSPFMAACYHGHLDVVRFLHALNISTNASSLLSPETAIIKLNSAGERTGPRCRHGGRHVLLW